MAETIIAEPITLVQELQHIVNEVRKEILLAVGPLFHIGS